MISVLYKALYKQREYFLEEQDWGGLWGGPNRGYGD